MSCLFNTLARFVDDINGDLLRKNICDYISTNPNLMPDDTDIAAVIFADTGLDMDSYINLLRNPSTFGGAIEIRAFTKMFNINVCVKSVPNNKTIEFIECPEYPWCSISWTGNHYDVYQK